MSTTTLALPGDPAASRQARIAAAWEHIEKAAAPPKVKTGVFAPQGKLDMEALIASAVRIYAPEREGMRRLIQPWQSIALAYYDAIGEIHYAGEFYSRAMQNVRLYVGERDEAGVITESENDAAKELLSRVQDPGGGRRLLQSRWGQLAFITGEALLLWTDETDDDEERWEIVSNDELRPDGAGGYLRMRAPALGYQPVPSADDDSWEPAPGTSIVYRLWKPHPRFSALADSPMRGVLDICKELLTLTQAVNAQAISHAARAGLLLVPEEIDFPAAEPGMDEDPNIDPFQFDLNKVLMAAIGDPASAAALAPIVVRAAAEYLSPEVFRWLEISDAKDRYPEENLRTECIRRIALGLDFPPEELLGKADASHWTSWEIDEDAWKHAEPIAWAFADSLAQAYLRPTARKEGIEGWERLCIGVDETAAVVKPDRGDTANKLSESNAISWEAQRDANDFDDDTAPSDEEMQLRIALHMNKPELLPAKYLTPEYRAAEDEKAAMAEEIAGQPAAEQPPEQSGASEQGPPKTKPTGTDTTQGNENAVTAAVEWVLGAAEMAHLRMREKAGSKARSAAQGCSDCKALIASMSQDLVVATLGPETVSDLGLDALEMVSGATDGFVAALVKRGVSRRQAELWAEQVETHAARNLFDPDPAAVPAGLAAHVRRGLED